MAYITKIEAGEHVREMYTPYAMSTIVDRALPDVRDGLKPVHRRILFSMWKSGIVYNIDRAKTTEPISETMKIHHHGDSSILDAISLMTEQNESLLHPFIDGEGAFGKVYSKDSPSAPRYTYCRLNRFSEEFFKDIKEDVIPMIGEDKKHLQPIVLSSDFPNILVKNNEGIACGEACKFPSFNLSEVCDATIAYIPNKNINLLDYLHGFDFSTGGYLIYNKENLKKIYNTGKGSIVLRAKYRYDEKDKCIDIYEIPYVTTVDAIIERIKELMKTDNFIKNSISDIRDETGFNKMLKKEEMKITIDVKRNTNINTLMKNLFKKTQLESTFSANMNCLVNYEPKLLGVKQILDEWLKFRKSCIKKSLKNKINNKSIRLHLLNGLKKVLLDIDKAISIIRQSESNKLVLNNLIKNFNIDEKQADFIINMKLGDINKDNIINKIKNIESLEEEINNYKKIIKDENLIDEMIIRQLKEVKKTYGKPRMTEIIYPSDIQQISQTDLIEDSAITMILTEQQYIKKTLKYSDKQTIKDGDKVTQIIQTTNKSDLLLFTNQGRLFTRKIYELTGKIECTPSSLGEYIPNLLKGYLNENEKVIYITATKDYKGNIFYAFDDNNLIKISLSVYQNKQNRQVAQDAYNSSKQLKYIQFLDNNTKDIDILYITKEGKLLIADTSTINPVGSGGRKSEGRTQLIKVQDNKFEGNCIIDTIYNINPNDKFIIKTNKKEIELDLEAQYDEKRNYYQYLKGKKGNAGNMIYNCRTKKDEIISINLLE